MNHEEWLETITDEHGCAFVQCSIVPGPYLIMLEEFAQGKCISCSIFNVCMSDCSINTSRSCYSIDPQYFPLNNRTLGGVFATIDNQGISLIHCLPKGLVRLYLLHPEQWMNLFHQAKQWQQEKQELEKKIDVLQNQIEKIYYAPGMPGFLEAKSDFHETSASKSDKFERRTSSS